MAIHKKIGKQKKNRRKQKIKQIPPIPLDAGLHILSFCTVWKSVSYFIRLFLFIYIFK